MAPRPFIPVPDTIEAEITFRLGTVYMSNRFYFSNYYPLFGPGDDLVVASSLATEAINTYLPCIASDVLLVHTRARFLNTASDPWVTVPLFGYFGTYPDVAMPANVCVRARGRRQTTTTKQRPYFCVPAPPRAAIVENEVVQAYADLVVEFYIGLVDRVGPDGTDFVWVSFETGGAWRSEGLTRYWPILERKMYLGPRRRRLRNIAAYP